MKLIRGNTWEIGAESDYDMGGGYLQVSIKSNRQLPDSAAELHVEFGPLPSGTTYSIILGSDITANVPPADKYFWDVTYSDRSVTPPFVETFTNPDATIYVAERTTTDP